MGREESNDSKGAHSVLMARTALFPTHMVQNFLLSSEKGLEHSLTSIAENEKFLEALNIASPTLAAELITLCKEGGLGDKKLTSLFMGVFSYLLRATTRSTPFGAFAGVGSVELGDTTNIELAEKSECTRRLRIDSKVAWAIVHELESDFSLRQNLLFYKNPSMIVWKSKIKVPYKDTYGQSKALTSVYINRTPVVERILDLSKYPVRFADLTKKLLQEYSIADEQNVSLFISKLIDEQVLLSTLRPPSTATNPLRYVHQKFLESSVDLETKAARKAKELLDLASSYNSTEFGAGTPIITEILKESGFVSGQSQNFFQVDTKINYVGSVDKKLINKVVSSVSILQNLLKYTKLNHLESYRTDFIERYAHEEVPLLEMIDADLGIGAPSGYQYPLSHRPSLEPKKVDDLFLIMIQKAAEKPGNQIDLLDIFDSSYLENLAGELENVDIFFRESIFEGQSLLIIDSVSGQGGAVLGRFTDIEKKFEDFWVKTAEKETMGNVIHSDVFYSDSNGHTNNVAIHKSIYKYETAVATTPKVDFRQHVPLEDILVGVVGDEFYFRSKSKGKRVLFRAPHLLNRLLAPNAVRFLLDVCEGQKAKTWDWQGLEGLTRFPRVSFRNVIVSPARWRISDELKKSVEKEWGKRFAGFRNEFALPRFVFAGFADNRLLLDLDNSFCVDLLGGLVRKGANYIEEALTDFESAQVKSSEGSHFTQFVYSIGKNYSNQADLPELPLPLAYNSTSAVKKSLLPFEECLYMKIYTPDNLQDHVIRRFASLLSTRNNNLGKTIQSWFFIRYRDPKAHIRLRILADKEQLVFWLTEVTDLLRHLSSEGLITDVIFDTYQREIARYGGVELIEVFESIFELDSEFVAILEDGVYTQESRLVRTTATLALLMQAMGLHFSEQLILLEGLCDRYKSEFVTDKSKNDTVESLLSSDLRKYRSDAWQHFSKVFSLDTPSSEMSKASVDLYRKLQSIIRLNNMDGLLKLSNQSRPLLGSVLHMHANRAGLTRFSEYRALHLCLRTLKGFKHYIPENIALEAYSGSIKSERSV